MSKIQTRVTKAQSKLDTQSLLEKKLVRQHARAHVQSMVVQASYRRVQANHHELTPAHLLAMQRTVGNRMVQSILKSRSIGSPPGDEYGIGDNWPSKAQPQLPVASRMAHVAQRNATTRVQRSPNGPSKLDRLRKLLSDDQENQAIAQMRSLSNDEKELVLNSREFKELAISAFDNDEMYRAMDALNGDLYKSLEWMFDEGTDWSKVRAIIRQARPGKDRIRADNRMKAFFVDICDDEEMAEAVDLLGGTLLQKLTWMQAEDSNWKLVKAKLQGTTDAAEKTALYGNTAMKAFFVDICDDEEMAAAVDLLGGTLLQKLTWMQAEDSNWKLVKAKLQGTTDAAEKTALYGNTAMKAFFVDICDDEEMAAAVDLLGGTLLQKLTWMQAEDSNWKLVKAKLQGTTDAAEKTALYGNTAMKAFFVDVCDDEEMAAAVDLLGGTLLQKLTWMQAEDSSWKLVKAKLQGTTDAAEKTALYGNTAMKAFFVDICDDEEMAAAVDLLGGTLLQKLTWMQAEDSNWKLVKAKLQGTTDAAEKTALYGSAAMKAFFVDICNDAEMTEAVTLLGGPLDLKIQWLIAEDCSAKYYYRIIRESPVGELTGVTAETRKNLRSALSLDEYNRIIQMLDSGLLTWGGVDRKYKEKVYEQKKPTSPWELETYQGHEYYDIEYTRTELRIIVRIKLTGEPTTPAVRANWSNGIQNRWNGKFHIEGPRRLKIVFDPQFTDNDPHHTLKIHNKPGMREDAGNWELNTAGDTAAHEFGHWVGNEDEYRRTAADFQRIVGRAPTPAEQHVSGGFSNSTELIMRTGQGDAQIRHFQGFLNWLNTNKLPGEAPYRLVAGP